MTYPTTAHASANPASCHHQQHPQHPQWGGGGAKSWGGANSCVRSSWQPINGPTNTPNTPNGGLTVGGLTVVTGAHVAAAANTPNTPNGGLTVGGLTVVTGATGGAAEKAGSLTVTAGSLMVTAGSLTVTVSNWGSC
jgi:hypothetical protein